MTPLDALVEALDEAGRFDPAVQARPEAVLWCDPDASFDPVIPLLRPRLERLHTLGVYDRGQRAAPAFELRALAARAQAAGAPPPVLWLPGVGREALKLPAACPHELEPLLWLAAAGTFFGHVNGKDWSLRGFLTAERGPLRIDIADGAEAKEALALAAVQLFQRPVEDLRTRRFDADALHALCAPDLAGEMLDWIEGRLDPNGDTSRFKAFGRQAKKTLGFDPLKRERSEAIRKMALSEGGWNAVWKRFESMAAYALPEAHRLLRLEEPPGDLFAHQGGFPIANQRAEDALRDALLSLADATARTAQESVLRLEDEHGKRRDALWGRTGEAPLAWALAHLAIVAQAPTWPAGDAEAIANAYFEAGAVVDGAVLEALAAVPQERDRAAVCAAVRALYSDWLDVGARRLQALAALGQVPFGEAEAESDAVVFVDGLRLDLGRRLARRLEALGPQVTLSWRWTGFPTSTATCKPLASPVAGRLHGSDGSDLIPLTPDGKPANHAALRKEMAAQGWGFDETVTLGRLWCEVGAFDDYGHKLQAHLVDQIANGLEDLAQKIVALAQKGRHVRVVTDHGWLLMPGGLPTAALGIGLVEPDQKRSRYARLKEGAATGHAQAAWTWNPAIRLAMAPGATSFYACDYAHGGVSPQECVVPVIDVGPMREARKATIVEASWLNLRLRLAVDGGGGLVADLRSGPEGSGASVAVKVRPLDEHGECSLLVSDEHLGKTATVVVLDGERVVARRDVKIGG